MSDETRISSQCLQQEEQAVLAINQRLANQGYQHTTDISHTRSVWRRSDQQMIVSLVDDIWDCAPDRSLDTPYLFDRNTTIITDNWINTPTVYSVLPVPLSVYGIYSYVPELQHWQPQRDYTFAVNRAQFLRIRILNQLQQHLGFDQGHVNFNCQSAPEVSATESFRDQLIYCSDQEQPEFEKLAQLMPLKNYDCSHEQAYVSSWLNITVETYSSDNVVALSEKIFRCLVTPVPWIVYSGRYTVARLRSLGFDVLDDIVDHDYDRLMEMQNKILELVDTARRTIETLKQADWSTLHARCGVAAVHNQKLLTKMKLAWPTDFNKWLTDRIT